MKTVSGKNILITGAAMGMGKLYAELAVQENAANLILWDINKILLEELTVDLQSKGYTKIHPFVVDISKLAEVESIQEKVLQEIGIIHILINNAGIVRGKYFWEHDYTDILTTMAVNAYAPMIVTSAFLPAMMSATNQECRIVNIASAAGLFGVPRLTVYCASKSACVGFSESLRVELKKQDIKHIDITTVMTSYITTGMFAGVTAMTFASLLSPDKVAKKVWRAMKKGNPQVIMPKSIYLARALKGLLPVRLFDYVLDKLGVYRSMQTFKGRKPK